MNSHNGKFDGRYDDNLVDDGDVEAAPDEAVEASQRQEVDEAEIKKRKIIGYVGAVLMGGAALVFLVYPILSKRLNADAQNPPPHFVSSSAASNTQEPSAHPATSYMSQPGHDHGANATAGGVAVGGGVVDAQGASGAPVVSVSSQGGNTVTAATSVAASGVADGAAPVAIVPAESGATDGQIASLKERIDRLEGSIDVVNRRMESLAQAVQAVQSLVESRAAGSRSASSSSAAKANANAVSEKKKGQIEKIPGYELAAVYAGQAWIRTPDGRMEVVVEGDHIGEMRVIKVRNDSVITSKGRID